MRENYLRQGFIREGITCAILARLQMKCGWALQLSEGNF